MDERERLNALVDDLRSSTAEGHWVEFKVNNTEPDRIGRYISALANSARMAEKPCGYLLWGIDDKAHAVVGTTFDPAKARKGAEPLEFWLSKSLDPAPQFTFKSVDHPDGKVVILEVQAASTAPVKFIGKAYIRIGDATPLLSDHGEQEARLWSLLQSYTWEAGVAMQFVPAERVPDLLRVDSYFELSGLPFPEGLPAILDRLQQDKLISPDIGGRWNILNLGALLFARDLSTFDKLSRKAVRVIEYSGTSRVKTKRERSGTRGYAAGFENLITFVDGLLPRNEMIKQALREERPVYPELAIRELIANALVHQDLTITGAGPMVEIFEDRIEITNPGRPLVEPQRFIDSPPRSRNEAVAALMRRMNMCEERGSGIDKVIFEVEFAQLPPPDFQVREDTTRVVLYGPRPFAGMTRSERVRACYQHTVLSWVSGGRATNATLRKRFGISAGNASQVSRVFRDTLQAGLIKLADEEAPKAGYVPFWA